MTYGRTLREKSAPTVDLYVSENTLSTNLLMIDVLPQPALPTTIILYTSSVCVPLSDGVSGILLSTDTRQQQSLRAHCVARIAECGPDAQGAAPLNATTDGCGEAAADSGRRGVTSG
jgi:hypothetical protein